MLSKVLKYEMKSSGRMLFPAFVLSLLLAAFARFMMFIAPRIWEPAGQLLISLASSLGILLLVGIVAFAFVFILIRFGQGMSSNEAYLSFTLPVSIDTHIIGRLISGTIFTFLSVITAILCGMIFIPDFISQFADMFDTVTAGTSLQLSAIPADIWVSGIGLILLFTITTIVFNILTVYASLGIGTRLTRSNILGGIAGYFILNSIESVLSLIFMLPLMGVFGSSNDDIILYFESLATDNMFDTLRNILDMMWIFIGVITLINIIFAVVHYFLTRYFYGKKLNLE